MMEMEWNVQVWNGMCGYGMEWDVHKWNEMYWEWSGSVRDEVECTGNEVDV